MGEEYETIYSKCIRKEIETLLNSFDVNAGTGGTNCFTLNREGTLLKFSIIGNPLSAGEDCNRYNSRDIPKNDLLFVINQTLSRLDKNRQQEILNRYTGIQFDRDFNNEYITLEEVFNQQPTAIGKAMQEHSRKINTNTWWTVCLGILTIIVMIWLCNYCTQSVNIVNRNPINVKVVE